MRKIQHEKYITKIYSKKYNTRIQQKEYNTKIQQKLFNTKIQHRNTSHHFLVFFYKMHTIRTYLFDTSNTTHLTTRIQQVKYISSNKYSSMTTLILRKN